MPDENVGRNKILKVIVIFFWIALAYGLLAWFVFQWRNPKANEMSFYRDFVDVVTWKKIPEYQK